MDDVSSELVEVGSSSTAFLGLILGKRRKGRAAMNSNPPAMRYPPHHSPVTWASGNKSET